MSRKGDKESSYKTLEKSLKNLSSEERDRIRSLLKNKDDSKDEKVEWIYKESKPDEEEYLLGRRVDRFIEQSSSREVAVKDIPGSTFKVEDDELIAKRADLDMQAKMREDPLFAIRKREEEARRRLLENPVKMKQLQKIISMRESEKKKKEKKHKKHKKHKKSTDSSGDEDDLVNKYLQILGKKHRLDDPEVKARLKKSMEEEEEEEERNVSSRDKSSHRHYDGHLDESHKSDKHHNRHRHDPLDRHGHRDRHTDRIDRQHDRKKDRHEDRKKEKYRKRRSSESSEEGTQSRPGHHGNTEMKAQYGLVKTSRYVSPERSKKQRSRSPVRRSRSPVGKRSPSPYKSSKRQRSRSPKSEPPKRKLTAAEKERLREEMMQDAKQRDEQRQSNVQRYREEDAREKQQHAKYSNDKTFINSLMTEHVSQSSVEDRIKRNKYNVQRTKAALDKSFRKH